MTDGQLNADVDQYLLAAGRNVAPPAITSDPLAPGASPVEQLLRVLGFAANAGDPADNAESADEHARRDAKTTEAAEEFANQDQQAGSQLAQQVPQLASGIAGAAAAALAPVAQIPQQLAQGAGQAIQAALGMAQQAGGDGALAVDDGALAEDGLTDAPDFGGTAGDLSDVGGGAPSADGFGDAPVGGPAGTTPAAILGPPPVPSAATYPASAPSAPSAVAPAPPAAPAAGTGMAGMPMMPGAMGGSAGSDRDGKADTRRVSVPSVRNGAPVQGRVTVPPAGPVVTRKIEGKPVAARRIMPAEGAERPT